MTVRNLLHRVATDFSSDRAARAQHRAIERAIARAVTPESRHELLVIEASHQ